MYRGEIAYAKNPALPKNSHGFPFLPLFGAVSPIPAGALDQIAEFFASNGANVTQPEPKRLFEVPAIAPLPEDIERFAQPFLSAPAAPRYPNL